MDQAVAVVIGAAIAFLGTFIGGIATPVLTARITERRRQRNDVREALIEVTDAFTRMWHYRQGKTKEPAFRAAMAAIAKLGLNVSKRESTIEQLAVTTLQIVQKGDDGQVAVALGTWQKVSGEWYRGEVKSSDVMLEAKRWATQDQSSFAASPAQ